MKSFNKFARIITVICALILSSSAFSQSFNNGDTYRITTSKHDSIKNVIEVKVRCLTPNASLNAPDDGNWVNVSMLWVNSDSTTKTVIKSRILSGTITKEGNYYFFNYLFELTPDQFTAVTNNSKKLFLKSLSKA